MELRGSAHYNKLKMEANKKAPEILRNENKWTVMVESWSQEYNSGESIKVTFFEWLKLKFHAPESYASHPPSDIVKPFGWHFNGRFYKALDDLRGRTMSDENQPLPLYLESYATKTYTPPTDEEIEKESNKYGHSAMTSMAEGIWMPKGFIKGANYVLSLLTTREQGVRYIKNEDGSKKTSGNGDAGSPDSYKMA